MALELYGYYKLPTLKEPQIVMFRELFHTSFMRKYTSYRSFEKFLTGGHFNITSQQDFENLPEEQMDRHVAKTTKFSSWQEMIDFATDRYIISQQSKNGTVTK